MSLRLEMLQVARLAPKVLGDSAGLVRQFLLSQQNRDHGFNDRAGGSDLYYTAFGLQALLALDAPPAAEKVADYLTTFGNGDKLDFVHLCCLARCWASVSKPSSQASDSVRGAILRRIETYRTPDGGYQPIRGPNGNAYGCFLALGAYQDFNKPMPNLSGLVNCLGTLKTPDQAWANEPGMTTGSTNATAAAVAVLRNLGTPVDPATGEWLLAQSHPEGGFRAAPNAPLPDLLSTATALHALAGLEVSFADIKERCLDFVDSLWTNEGGFHGHWADDFLDCEYTFYGLLALGHLSL